MGDDNNIPVVANTVTGAVTADTDAPLNKPSRTVVSAVWLGIVYGAIMVTVMSAGALVWGMFHADRASLVKPETVLLIFTTSFAFLMGLIARDPGQHNN